MSEMSRPTSTRSPDPLPPTASYHSPLDPIGTVLIGKYKVLEMIGEGGMGAVYLAQQTDPVTRLVAIKLIKTGMDSKSVLVRFEAERQALALMDHPNIAKIFDGGISEFGSPFFVMEWVKGSPITKFADDKKLTPLQRLELFIPVCQAIQHAHQKGVIHRDIKPSNILVTLYDNKPIPKVIDFGIAKAIGQPLTQETLHTGLGGVVGTPQYMSPEQATLDNLDIDTRSDVYSLGILLYELLVGTTPFSKKEAEGVLETLRRIREEDPLKPSSKLGFSEAISSISLHRGMDSKQLLRLLQKELDWIVMKSIDKDPSRRYETANNFAQDIQRYLQGEPVVAVPPTTRYRLKKFLQKNKGPVIAIGLILLALVVGMVGMTYGLIQANHQRELAEKARNRTREALDAMTSSITEDSLARQKVITPEQKKFLEKVLTYYQEFAEEEAHDPDSRARIAGAAYRLGLIESRLGRTEESRSAYEKAMEGYTQLVHDFPQSLNYRQDLGSIHHNLAVLCRSLGQFEQAEEHSNQALLLQQALVKESPLPDYQSDLGATHNHFAGLLQELGKLEQSESEFLKALEIRERLANRFPSNRDFQSELATTLHSFSFLLTDLGKIPEAEKNLFAVLKILEDLCREEPNDFDHKRNLATIHNSLGLHFKSIGKRKEAEHHLQQAIEMNSKLAHEFPSIPECREALGINHYNLGALFYRSRDLVKAEEYYRHAMIIREKLFQEFSEPKYQSDLASSYGNLGSLLQDLNKYSEAEHLLQKSLDLWEKLAKKFPKVPQYHADLARTHLNLAGLFESLHQFAQAEERFQKSLAIRQQLVKEFSESPEYLSDVATSHHFLGIFLKKQKKYPEAEEHLQKALTIQYSLVTKFPKVDEYQTALGMSYSQLGELHFDLQKWEESLTWYDRAISKLSPIVERNTVDLQTRNFLRQCYTERAAIFHRLKRYSEAVRDWDRVLELLTPEYQDWGRAQRAYSLHRAKIYDRAISEVTELIKRTDWIAEDWYHFGCIYSVASQKFPDKREEYAKSSIECLHHAFQAGWTNPAFMTLEPDLDPLRGREDFKKLLQMVIQAKTKDRELLPHPRLLR